jgi:hypothetical protein
LLFRLSALSSASAVTSYTTEFASTINTNNIHVSTFSPKISVTFYDFNFLNSF